MRRKPMRFAIITMLGSTLIGCKSHQATVRDLQNEYDELARQFQQDCSGEYLDVPPKLSQKCREEDAKMKAAWDRLKGEQTKR